MNQLIYFLRKKLKIVLSQRFWLILLALATLSLSLGIKVPLNAQYIPAATATNTWRYASFPVENAQGYTSGFGYRTSPVTGQSQFHYGLDIAAPLGSYVRNWWEGQIVELSDNTGCGTMIKIRSGQWTHIYCHLMGSVGKTPQGQYLMDQQGGIVLWLGQNIPLGARIGRVGMTGRSTGPHLHWGLMYGQEYVDPALILQEMFSYQIENSRSG